VQVGLLQPMIGQELRKAGADRGTADGHGVGITCSNTDGALRTCHSRRVQRALHCTGGPTRGCARHGRGVWRVHARPAGRGSGEVRGALAQASRPAETGDPVPDLQIGTALYELKGIRSDHSRSNYNGAQVTGVEKRGSKIPMEITRWRSRSKRWIWTRGCSGWLHRRWGRGSGSSTSWAG
jgi:hypothetical protein